MMQQTVAQDRGEEEVVTLGENCLNVPGCGKRVRLNPEASSEQTELIGIFAISLQLSEACSQET